MVGIENLAVSTKNGFDEVNTKLDDSKKEFTEFKKDAELSLYNVDRKLQTVDDRLEAIERSLGPLVQIPLFMQKEIRNQSTLESLAP